eukprot:Skav225976  [mRNA]  locus=scaffold4916:89768:92281:- [translate_table: standard]
MFDSSRGKTALFPTRKPQTFGQAIDTLHFVLKEQPANLIALRAFKGTTYVGSIKPTATVCWVSFPGKFTSGWEALIHYHSNDSVACVFLDDPEHGLGQHHFPDPQNRERCLCTEIYGERGYKEFGYLMTVKDPCPEEQKKKLRQRARAMHAHVVFGDATEKDEEIAQRLWEENKRRAAWGCGWFQIWFGRVQEAVRLGQRLKVVFFPSEVGCGKVAWHRLPFANLWDGLGLGGSQKGEVAKLEQMKRLEPGGKWDYDEVDVTDFLKDQFQPGKVVDACDSATNRFSKAKILQILHPNAPDGELKWRVQHVTSKKSFETSRIRHTTEFFENLVQNCGKSTLKDVLKHAVGLEVDTVSEEQLDNGRPCLQVKFHMQTDECIRQTQMLRDAVLSDDLGVKLNAVLTTQHGVTEELAVDNVQFLNHYTKRLMTFTRLTPHQTNKLKDVCASPHVHLTAPAGGGKTFVALRFVLIKLQTSTAGSIMYVCPNQSLFFHFLQWLLMHMSDHEWLKRMVVLHKPYTQFMQVSIQNRRMVLQKMRGQPTETALAIFDEAHEVLRIDNSLFNKIEAQQKMLLSDISQSHSLHVAYPDVRKVTLTQVVRSTKRVVAGAASFGLQDSGAPSCIGTTGPPLKTFLFATPKDDKDGHGLFGKFADKTVEALLYLVQTYPSIRFEQDVAVIVPDEQFYNRFKAHFVECLRRKLSPSSQVVSFEESLACLPGDTDRHNGDEFFILDLDDNARGLEKLFIVCVGFDVEIKGADDNSARARFYHSITRAQLQTVVVDRFLRGGWFEFLTTLELRNETFEKSTAEAEVRKNAARQIVDAADAWLKVRLRGERSGVV